MNLAIGQTSRGVAQLAPRFANRHGLITGATGSGKTVSVMRVVELLSAVGAPCLVFDAKGDLSGLAARGRGDGPPVEFIDVLGATARPAPLSFETMGPDVTARALGLSHAQSGVVDIAFAAAAAWRAPIATPHDMRAMLARLERGAGRAYGHVSPVSAAVVRRQLIRLVGSAFAAVPYDVAGLLCQRDGRGIVTICDARALSRSPALYSAAVAMILGELFERLPDIGDAPRPKLAVFIDESHLVFEGIEPALSARLESIVRLIRSRGVALWFASQSPSDVPPVIAAQLANRIQHAMRAVSRADAAQVRAAAESMPADDSFDVAAAIGKLRPGEAIVSLVGASGAPSPAAIARIIAPACRLGGLSDGERDAFKPAPIGAPAGDADWTAAKWTAAVIGFPLVGLAAGLAWRIGPRTAGLCLIWAIALYALRRPLAWVALACGLLRHGHGHGGH